MNDILLKSLDVTNFRSIRGHIHAPLDAKVVLIHGENGAGKTSLLSSIELALTGHVQSLERADQGYARQLLHRSSVEGNVLLRTALGATERDYEALLTDAGASSVAALGTEQAKFFRERSFLPQSLLGQLLQIYQDAGSDASSPLSQFVGKLLGLDRLDALEAGLKPLADVRNVRKTVDGWLAAENEKSRLDRLLSDQRTTRNGVVQQIAAALNELRTLCTELGLTIEVSEETLDTVEAALNDESDNKSFDTLTDQQRRLGAIQREISAAGSTSDGSGENAAGDEASEAYARWEAEHGGKASDIRARVEALLPDLSLPSDPEQLLDAALTRLRTEQKQASDRADQARIDFEREVAAQSERDVAQRQRDTIDQEVGRLSSTAGSLGSVLAELTSFITDETCPVCDRDFSEVGKLPLSEHVHHKVRTLSASAERLLVLGRTRGEVQVTIERLDREIEAIAARKPDAEALAALDRRVALLGALISEVDGLGEIFREGGRLRAADIAARRSVSTAQSRNVALSAARETLSDFARSIGAEGLAEGETFSAGMARLEALLSTQSTALENRLSLRRRGGDHIASIRSAAARRKVSDDRITEDFASFQRAEEALERAQKLRDQGNAIRGAVDTVRSAIIRREFNDRLNRVWRDLFVRLAPGEPFVPAFRIPDASTQKLQPKLITEHRDGGSAGGTPGAMLSSGNLNTAALTLFIALHLAVPKDLPWLILDDPVQSMDDVHIAHFAALLRTLSKEHGRQMMIAVHDRQLFEYLKLELSPAFPDDSLLTLELSRGPRRDSICVPRRFVFKEETALLAAA
ncbi:AAA family ATPase [Novosphingobium sp. BW1]|uniref:AAA family ATPase n=1 Tax=Novosphingobium sp. BW1 TaxID=2592621 RepID=UPI0011DEC19B|nr:AAA family ATPase [Novosphingobium sp. BW1]TYC86344.1 AAA family ATPase [Novosphingobium sp. BW1]